MSPLEDEPHIPHRHRPRESPHEQALSREELDEEEWFEEEGDEMVERVHDLEAEIDEADRTVHGPGEDEIAGGHHH